MLDEETKDFLNQLVKTLDELAMKLSCYLAYQQAKEDDFLSRSRDPDQKEDSMQYQKIKIKQRLDGRWYARYKFKNSCYHDIYGRTQQECYDKLRTFCNSKVLIDAAFKGKSGSRRSASPSYTLGKFFLIWLREEKEPECKDSTIRFYDNVFKNHLRGLAQTELNKLSADVIRSTILSISSMKIRRAVFLILSMIFRTALRRDLIKVNPMEKILPPKYKSKERQAFTRDEERRFVEIAKDYDCAVIFWLMLYEGLRTSEAKALAPCDIHEDYIEVRHSLDDYGQLVSTKTDKVRRVPIFSEFKEFADRYRGSSETPILGKVNKHTAVREYAEICKAAGITKNMYCLRHTFATRCEEARISSKQTALWLGHSSINTTLSYYININKEFELENVAIKNGLHKS